MLEDNKIDVKVKLAALWCAATLCYIYGDIVAFYQPGAITRILSGKMGPLGDTTQGLLLGVAIFMSVPCLMVFASVALKPRVNRFINLLFGALYTLAMLATMLLGAWAFYLYFGIVEIALTLTVVGMAWKWPRVPQVQRPA